MAFDRAKMARAKRIFKQLPQTVTLRLEAQNAKNARILANVMRGFVPIDEGVLDASIIAVKVKRPSGVAWSVRAGDFDAYYARFVEFGTDAREAQEPRRNARYKRRLVMTTAIAAHHGTKAQPFFWPAYRMMKRRMKSGMSRAGKKGIQEAVAK